MMRVRRVVRSLGSPRDPRCGSQETRSVIDRRWAGSVSVIQRLTAGPIASVSGRFSDPLG